MIIDGHAHLGMGEYSNVKYYLDIMEKNGIDKTVVCVGDMVDVTKMADFMRGKEPLLNYSPQNHWIKSAITEYPDKFYGFFMVDPEIHEISDIEQALEDGFVGIKLNPLISKINFYSDFMKGVFMLSHEKRIPIYTHLTMNPSASIESLTSIVEEYRPYIIIGHMGFASADWEAVELAGNYKNVYLETSVGSYRTIKEAIKVIGAKKIIFGSEGPSHHAAVELKKIMMLELSEAQLERVLYKNIMELIEGRI